MAFVSHSSNLESGTKMWSIIFLLWTKPESSPVAPPLYWHLAQLPNLKCVQDPYEECNASFNLHPAGLDELLGQDSSAVVHRLIA